MDSITLVLLLTITLLVVMCVVVLLARQFDRRQFTLFGFLLLPILGGLYGGYIPYPVNPGKIYLLYVVMAVLLTISRARLKSFLEGPGLTLVYCFGLLLSLNSLSYFFVNGSLVLNLSSTLYLFSLFLITLYSYCARVSEEDVDRVLPVYSLVVLLPICVVCALELSGQRHLSLFFAGPEYENISTERLNVLRLNGIFQWPTNLANYLSSLFVLYVWRGHRSRSFVLAGIVIFICICLTFTRASIVGCVCVVALSFRGQGRRFQSYMWTALIAVLSLILWQQARGTIGEVADQYIHNEAPRTYYVLEAINIAKRNFPLGEGAYSTGAYTSVLGERGVQQKYNLSTDYKTTEGVIAATLIEFGFLGAGLLLGMVLWLWSADRSGLIRYLVILLGFTAYSNADILSPMRAENIVFFLAAGLSLSTIDSQSRKRVLRATQRLPAE